LEHVALRAIMDISARAISLPDRPRTGHLGHQLADDPGAQPRVAAFESGLRELGWLDGRNLRIEYRWVSDGDLLRSIAAELACMPPT